MQQQAAPSEKRNPVLWLIFFIILMDVVGFSILLPVAPFIVQRYSNNAIMVTLLSTIYAAASFFAAPALGQISDRVGRRPVLIWSVFGSAIGYFMFGLGGALWVLFLSRLIDGITGGNISTANAYIADVSKPQDRPKNFALIGMAWGFGFIIGPALGTAASTISLEAPAYVAGAIALISVVVMFFALPESLPKDRRVNAPLTLQSLNPIKSIDQIASKPGMPLLMCAMLAFNFAFSSLSNIQNVFLRDRFHVDPPQIGTWLLLGGIGTAISQFLLSEKLLKKFGEKNMGLASLGVQSFGTLLIITAPVFLVLMVAAPFLGMLRPFIWGALGSLMAAKVHPHEMGVMSGVNSALQNATAIIGPAIAGGLYDHVSATSPLLMCMLSFLLGMALLFIVKPSPRPTPQAAWK